MDAHALIVLLQDLGPLATQYGWPAVFFAFCLPRLLDVAKAHVELMRTLREELPRVRRNQRVAIKCARKQVACTEGSIRATEALTVALEGMATRPGAASPAV